MKKFVFAVSSTAFAISSAAPAFAQVTAPVPAPDGVTTAAMISACSNFALTLIPTNDQSTFMAAPSQISGQNTSVTETNVSARVITNQQPDLTSSVTYSGPNAAGATQLARNGKSPNIFVKDAHATTATYANSTYTYSNQFHVVSSFSYQCHVTENVYHPATPPQGTYKLKPGSPAQDDCSRFDDPTSNPNFGDPTIGNCVFNQTAPGTMAGSTPTDRGDQGMFAPITQESNPDPTISGLFEPMGGSFTVPSTQLVQVVVCISPGKNPGDWRAVNFYDGICSTAVFNSIAPGTLIPSASLPLM